MTSNQLVILDINPSSRMMGGYIVLIMLYPSTLHMHKMVDQFDIVSWIAKCEPLQKTYTHHSDKSEVDMILESM